MDFFIGLLSVWYPVSPRAHNNRERIQDRALVLLQSDLRSDTPRLLPYAICPEIRSGTVCRLAWMWILGGRVGWGHCTGSYHVWRLCLWFGNSIWAVHQIHQIHKEGLQVKFMGNFYLSTAFPLFQNSLFVLVFLLKKKFFCSHYRAFTMVASLSRVLCMVGLR